MERLSLTDLLAYEAPGWGGALLRGTLTTLEISIGAFAAGVAIGLLCAVGKLSGARFAAPVLNTYTTVVRAIPELILIVALYYAGTDSLNALLNLCGFESVEINGFVTAILVLGLVQGAYATEVLRGAIVAIPVGQVEAGKAFGMPPMMRFRRIILPAMMPTALPGLSNLWASVTKDSALVAVLGYQELAMATRLAASNTKFYLLFFCVAALIYLVITLISNSAFGALERRFRRGHLQTDGGAV